MGGSSVTELARSKLRRGAKRQRDNERRELPADPRFELGFELVSWQSVKDAEGFARERWRAAGSGGPAQLGPDPRKVTTDEQDAGVAVAEAPAGEELEVVEGVWSRAVGHEPG